MQDFHNIGAWEKAHALALEIYRETQSLPREEVFGAASQLRKSALAIPTRIAEGAGRISNPEFAIDIRKAIASCSELEYLIFFSAEQKLWQDELAVRLTEKTVEVRKMLYGFLKSL